MPIKTKEIRKILEPIEAQVNTLKTLTRKAPADSNDVLASHSLIIDRFRSLGQKFDALSKEDTLDYQELKTKITEAVEEFCSLERSQVSIDDVRKQEAHETVSTAFDKFTSALEILEKLECLPLKQSLLDCWDYVREMGLAREIEHFQNAKELGTSILELLGPLQRYRRSLVSPLLSTNITLYSGQLCTAFKLLVRLIQEQHDLNAPIYNCKKYVCERFCFCLKTIIEVMDASEPSAEDEFSDRENHFVYRMDLALDVISEMQSKTQEEQVSECEELWLRIEDVFSYAMAIAQLCDPYNFKAITGACQSVISEYENLKQQLQSASSDRALNTLFMTTLNDALYRLERKVNVSVLNLVMEVFSDPFNALKKLVMTCGNSLSAKKRSKSDLTAVIEDFDQTIDQTMQIGLFAIASCKDKNRINQIRNCLAGIESLETELISAVTAFYLRPDSKEMRANVKLLTAQWQLEINKLHDAIDLVMDSAAYCEVVLDDLQERISTMSNCLDNREGVTQIQVQAVVQRSLSLSRQISAVINDVGSDIIERQTIMMVRELKAAIFEADAASKNLLTENATEPQQLRVIKRCELILNVVKRLQPALVTIMNSTSLMSTNYGKNGKGQGDTVHDASIGLGPPVCGSSCNEKTLTYVRTPYTVRNCKSPLSIQPANSVPRAQLDLSCLIPYIRKGREVRLERSIMYKTQRRDDSVDRGSTHKKLKPRDLTSIRQHLFSRDSVSYRDDLYLSEESMALTGILEKFASSCSTLNTISSKSRQERIESVAATDVSNERSGTNLSELLVRSIEARSDVIRSSKVAECATVGAGDGPSIIAASTGYAGKSSKLSCSGKVQLKVIRE